MKTLWNIVSVVAVANLLALAALGGWLRTSGRMDLERAGAIRAMVSRPIADEKAEALAAAAKAEEERKATEREAKAARAPLTAEQRLDARGEATDLDRQRAQRLQREVADLQRGLAAEREAIAAERAALDAERKAFEELVQGSLDAVTNAQFQKSLAVLTALKPAQAASLLKTMMGPPATASFAPVDASPAANTPAAVPPSPGPGAQEEGLRLAISYLDAMDEKPRGKILAEYAKTDPDLAARLLERLRKRGQPAAAADAN